jgi:penicillin G amidase
MRSLLAILALATLLSPRAAAAQPRAAAPAVTTPRTDTLRAPGLTAPVEILTDAFGVAHIYAQNEPDLFFAQGYNAARDRLFQFELWRRQATGTVAELLGAREVERDIGARLFMFRGDMARELAHYHPRGEAIVHAFVRGVNAYIAEARRTPATLPIEFRLLGTLPEPWTPEVVISRHAGLLANVRDELELGRAVHAIGPTAVARLQTFTPRAPRLALDSTIDGALLSRDILARYNAFRRAITFTPSDIVSAADRADADAFEALSLAASATARDAEREERRDIGSNNWVIAGSRTASGWPLLANDPHRAIAAPSLRYWAHLVAPGWNVIGGGEPTIPGISIGHNEHGAWGLTIFGTDAEDLYVYTINPANPREYRYRDGWERMREIIDTIRVKGERPRIVTHRFTRHGPVVFEDAASRTAYAVRAAWMDVGGAPYLASLRMNQARTWEEFLAACAYSHIPAENMIWADRAGNIGWQAVGIAPVRAAWDGLVPVPGDGRYEWDGYLPILQRPGSANPPAGYLATANANLTDPFTYPYMNAIGFQWADPFRQARVNEVLASGRQHTMADMIALQHDVLSLPARALVPLLQHVQSADAEIDALRRAVLAWDRQLTVESIEAGVYVAWERRLLRELSARLIPQAARPALSSLGMSRTIDLLLAPPPELAAEAGAGATPIAGRDSVVLRAFEGAVADLRRQLGADVSRWQYGQAAYKHARIEHPLSAAVSAALRDRLDVGPAPRGGNAYTVLAAGAGNNQSAGASFRLFVDLQDWDRALGMNVPGQSGNPDSPHYRDLFDLWARNMTFPVYYSRDRIEQSVTRREVLRPR